MNLTINYANGKVLINELENNKRHLVVRVNDDGYVAKNEWVTAYPIELVENILEVKGLNYLCDEIMRDEDPHYIQRDLFFSLMSYVTESSFEGKRILDFGCGCGASTMVLARMFPNSSIVGVELEKNALEVARKRLEFYEFENVDFSVSPSGKELPRYLDDFDYIILSGVYEHLLPDERILLIPKLWNKLKENGILFINQTPDRRFPIETHTTGLPLINYLPNSIVCFLSQKFSKKVKKGESWSSLLRAGIRGGTDEEILNILMKGSLVSGHPVLLQPTRLGVDKQSDIWYEAARERLGTRYQGVRKYFIFLIINIILKIKIPLAPYLSLAFKKTISC